MTKLTNCASHGCCCSYMKHFGSGLGQLEPRRLSRSCCRGGRAHSLSFGQNIDRHVILFDLVFVLSAYLPPFLPPFFLSSFPASTRHSIVATQPRDDAVGQAALVCAALGDVLATSPTAVPTERGSVAEGGGVDSGMSIGSGLRRHDGTGQDRTGQDRSFMSS